MPGATRLLWTGLIATSLIACGPRYRKEIVGSGTAGVGATGGGVAIADGGGLHQFDLAISMPHAMRIEYRLACPEVTRTGQLGETFEQYRQRRIAELEREREQQKKTAGALAGAVLGNVGAGAAVETPTGGAEVDATVDGAAAGEAVAEQALPEVQLPPGDTGGRVIREKLVFPVGGAGSCTLTLSSAADGQSIDGLSGSFSVQRLIDIKAEKRAARIAANQAAVEVRGSVSANLVALGADPEKRARERAAARAKAAAERRARLEAKWRADAERRARRDAKRRARLAAEAEARAEADARRQAELEIRYAEERRARLELDAALAARGRVVHWLTDCGGEPGLRERLERERRERARLVVATAIDIRGRLRGQLRGLGADPDYRRKREMAEMRAFEARARAQREARQRAELALRARTQVALEARASLKIALEGAGAIDRPPMPTPVAESRTEAPFTGAVWVDGYWVWQVDSWVWIDGSWEAPPAAEAVWVAPTEVSIGGTVVIRPGGWIDRAGKQIRVEKKARGTVRVRDHRR